MNLVTTTLENTSINYNTKVTLALLLKQDLFHPEFEVLGYQMLDLVSSPVLRKDKPVQLLQL